MTALAPDTRSRAFAAAGAVALQALIGWALISGLSVRIGHIVDEQMAVFDVTPTLPPPPQPKPLPERRAAPRKAGAAAPPHARATPVPVVTPPPVVIQPPLPPVITAAPIPALGPDASAGAAVAGPGTGAGGQGDGRGAGAGGDGTGGGGGVRARFLRGRIKDGDYPEAERRAGISGDVTTRYLIDTHGRIARCSITSSSGNADLDAATCRLAIERFRYVPARDASGRAVEDTVYEDHSWVAQTIHDYGDGPGN